jgi:hypothetical protein
MSLTIYSQDISMGVSYAEEGWNGTVEVEQANTTGYIDVTFQMVYCLADGVQQPKVDCNFVFTYSFNDHNNGYPIYYLTTPYNETGYPIGAYSVQIANVVATTYYPFP